MMMEVMDVQKDHQHHERQFHPVAWHCRFGGCYCRRRLLEAFWLIDVVELSFGR